MLQLSGKFGYTVSDEYTSERNSYFALPSWICFRILSFVFSDFSVFAQENWLKDASISRFWNKNEDKDREKD